MIVNSSLIMLLAAIVAFCLHATAEWKLVQQFFKADLGRARIAARTDGYLETNDEKTTAIIEVKPYARVLDIDQIQMQESTQIAAAIASRGFPDPETHR